MHREWHKWFSPSLGRDMEMLIFGHAGVPVVVYPTSQGRYFEFEDQGMVAALAGKLDHGEIQLFCVDSVDAESWYNRHITPRWKIARHMQYERYVLDEILPLIRQRNQSPHLAALGCSFGGYHAANICLRHPDLFTGFLSMGGAFDVSNFLRGYYDQDCYFNLPTHYIPNTSDSWYLDRYRRSTYILATGEWDICRGANERFAEILHRKGIPARLDIWGDHSKHDWPEWKKMAQHYL